MKVPIQFLRHGPFRVTNGQISCSIKLDLERMAQRVSSDFRSTVAIAVRVYFSEVLAGTRELRQQLHGWQYERSVNNPFTRPYKQQESR